MVRLVLDTSVLLEYARDQPGAEDVEKWLKKGANGEATLLVSAMTVCEIMEKLTRVDKTETALNFLDCLKESAVVVMDVTEEIARLAGPVKARNPKLSTADALIMTTAYVHKAKLYTFDKGFWGMGGVDLMGL
jgi:predicted nucleic acid-binding protein